jgi:hypothetical protein
MRFLDRFALIAIDIVWIATVIWLVIHGIHFKDPLDWLTFTLLSISTLSSLLHTFIERTLLTDNGVDHRTWYGKKLFIPYSDLSVLNRNGRSVVLTNGIHEITLGKMNSDFPQIATFLREKVGNQMSLDSVWQ